MYDPFGPNEDDTDDSWIDELSFQDILALSEDTTQLQAWSEGTTPYVATGVDAADIWGPDQQTISDNTIGDNAIGGRTSGRGSASAGANGSGSEGGSIFDGMQTFIRENPNLIGLGATVGSMWLKTISDNRNASQEDDANWWKRANAEQEKKDTITRSEKKSDTDWEREKERIRLGQEFITTTNAQKQKDQLEIIAAQNAGRGSSSSGGGGGFDPAAARAARVSASIKGMKAPTTGIVNSNIWGNALNTLQRK